MVGEHSVCCEAFSVRSVGAIRKDFVGISSDNACENHAHRKPKVSCVKLICAGLVCT
jgi:hypothetical protein